MADKIGKITPAPITISFPSAVTVQRNGCYQIGKLVVIDIRMRKSGGYSADSILATNLPLPINKYNPDIANYANIALANNQGIPCSVAVNENNETSILCSSNSTAEMLLLNGAYITE